METAKTDDGMGVEGEKEKERDEKERLATTDYALEDWLVDSDRADSSLLQCPLDIDVGMSGMQSASAAGGGGAAVGGIGGGSEKSILDFGKVTANGNHVLRTIQLTNRSAVHTLDIQLSSSLDGHPTSDISRPTINFQLDNQNLAGAGVGGGGGGRGKRFQRALQRHWSRGGARSPSAHLSPPHRPLPSNTP